MSSHLHTSAASMLLASTMLTSIALAQWDGELTPAARQKLDAYAVRALNVAEDLWNRKAYEQATLAYSSFARELPKSPAAPYALYRAARAIHLQEKREEAIAAYNEVVDRYPTNVTFAAPALFFMGICEIETGGPGKAHERWKELIEDKDYQRHPLAAEAMLRIIEYYRSINQAERALALDEKLATDFRTLHVEVARTAMLRVARQHLRDPPGIDKIKTLYRKCGSFEATQQKVPDDLSKDGPFWTQLAGLVRQNGDFPEMWIEPKRKYFAYWACAFEPVVAWKEDVRDDVLKWYQAAERNEDAARAALIGERTAPKLAQAAELLVKAKKNADAAALLKELVDRFPQSAEAAKAKTDLERLTPPAK